MVFLNVIEKKEERMVYLVVRLLIRLAAQLSGKLNEDEIDLVAKIHKVYKEHRALPKPIWR